MPEYYPDLVQDIYAPLANHYEQHLRDQRRVANVTGEDYRPSLKDIGQATVSFVNHIYPAVLESLGTEATKYKTSKTVRVASALLLADVGIGVNVHNYFVAVNRNRAERVYD